MPNQPGPSSHQQPDQDTSATTHPKSTSISALSSSSLPLRNWLKRQFLADVHTTTETATAPLRVHKIMGKILNRNNINKTAVEAWNAQPLKLVSLAILLQEVIHEVLAETGSATVTMVEERGAWAQAVEDRTVQLVLAEANNSSSSGTGLEMRQNNGEQQQQGGKQEMRWIDPSGWDWESLSESSEGENNT